MQTRDVRQTGGASTSGACLRGVLLRYAGPPTLVASTRDCLITAKLLGWWLHLRLPAQRSKCSPR